MNPVLVAVAAALVVALGAVGVLAGEGEEAEQAAERPRGPSLEQVTERVAEVARDVERVRELEFERLPRVRVVSPAEARRAALRELDEQVPRRRQRIEERLLVMLGLLPPDTRLREVIGKALTEEVAGYYIPRSGTLALVGGEGLDGFLAEVTLAHELTHALEDQHFGIEAHGASGFLGDRSVADAALREGTATLAMLDYVALTQGGGAELPDEVRRQVLQELSEITLPASSGLPRYVREGLVWPYAAGAGFVDWIQGEGGWAAVDRAYEEDPPRSSEQIMHPRKYEAGERPARVKLRGLRAALGADARVISRGDLGEFDTEQFLRDANGRRRSQEAAAGWGGSSIELWRAGGGKDVLVMGWAWDTARDAREFAAAAELTLARLGGAGAVNDGNEGMVTVVLAPEASLARRVARRISR
ncbi:MAG TPA: hypothetical protein VG126_16920 [Thermoleophilaceae bacterium]|nr:hypothetical protein [Thermoleophilaceae bacterium]